MCPTCAIQSLEKAPIKSGWTCGWNWDWNLSDLRTTQTRRQRGGRREPDGSLSVNRRGDLEYFFYCPHCPICLCHSETQMCECKRGVHFEEHFGRKRNHVMITSIRYSISTRYSLTVHEESSIYMLNILPLIKEQHVAFYCQ